MFFKLFARQFQETLLTISFSVELNGMRASTDIN